MQQIGVAAELTRGCAEAVWPGVPRNAGGVTLRITVTENGQSVDLTGMDVCCHIMRGDGSGVDPAEGAGYDGYAEVTLPAEAFAVPGECRLMLRAENETAGARVTLAVVRCIVEQN